MEKTLLVTAIDKGTVIDHIPAGQAITILRLLNLAGENNQATIGLNLTGDSGLKDIIKMENRHLTEHEAQEIGIFAPNATINIIEEFEVKEKLKAVFPEKIINIFICPNPMCITQSEPIKTHFHLHQLGNKVNFQCHYCEKAFMREEMRERVG